MIPAKTSRSYTPAGRSEGLIRIFSFGAIRPTPKPEASSPAPPLPPQVAPAAPRRQRKRLAALASNLSCERWPIRRGYTLTAPPPSPRGLRLIHLISPCFVDAGSIPASLSRRTETPCWCFSHICGIQACGKLKWLVLFSGLKNSLFPLSAIYFQ